MPSLNVLLYVLRCVMMVILMPVLIVHSISWLRVDALDTKAGRLPLHQARVEVGDPFVFYSKLKHCKSYFGESTQTTGITMLVIV